jgi:hypothetical protein
LTLQILLFSLNTPRDCVIRRVKGKLHGSNAINRDSVSLALRTGYNLRVCSNSNTEKNGSTDIGSAFGNYTEHDGKVLMNSELTFIVQDIRIRIQMQIQVHLFQRMSSHL